VVVFRELDVARQLRETRRQEALGGVLRDGMTTNFHIYPSFGETAFLEFSVRVRVCVCVVVVAFTRSRRGSAWGRSGRCDRALTQSHPQVSNPFVHDDRFAVRVDDPLGELRLVTSADEWSCLRRVRA
jgi:hypothetical protein